MIRHRVDWQVWVVMPRAHGIGMPKKQRRALCSLKPTDEVESEPAEVAEQPPAAALPPKPTSPGKPVPSPAKLRRQAAVALVKERCRECRVAEWKLQKSSDRLARITESQTKAMDVLERPRPPRVRLPPRKRQQMLNKMSIIADSARDAVIDCRQAHWVAKEDALYAIIASRNTELARLRSLLRKHCVPTCV